MGWTLPELRALEADEFEELCAWARERAKPKDEESVDADELVAAMDERKRREQEEQEDSGLV